MTKKIDKLAPRIVQVMEFWSIIDDEILLTQAASDDDLPSVGVQDIPVEATIIRAVAIIRIRAIENTYAGLNGNVGATNIRVKKSTGAWGVDDIAAIALTDNQWMIPTSAREEGDFVQEGSIDVSAEVDDPDADYDFRFEDNQVDQDSLKLQDVQMGLRIYFTIKV